MPENEDAWDLWTNVLTQWRVGPNGVIGLDYNAAAMIAGVIEIEFDKVVLRKLRVLEQSVLKGIHDKQVDRPHNDPKSAFCRACRVAKKNVDCSTCNIDQIIVKSPNDKTRNNHRS
ncbi:MAG: hypothetical protein STSR0003_03550 [Smithella sp.]